MFAFFTYLLTPVTPLLVLLFGRRNHRLLYHACQALAIVFGFLAVVLGWAVFGWLTALVSTRMPMLYIIPIALALVAPIWGMYRRSRLYHGRSIWFNMLTTAIFAGVVVWGCWRVIEWLSPTILPIFGTLMLMASFALVIAGAIVAVVGWILGMVNGVRGLTKPAPVYGAWGMWLFNRLTRKERRQIAEDDLAAEASASIAAMHADITPLIAPAKAQVAEQ